MADVVKDFTKVGVKEETTEGVFNAPVDADYHETLEDGASITKTRETKERNVLSGDRLRSDLRLSRRDVEVEVPVEAKASDIEGGAPKYQPYFHAFGFKNRGLASAVITEDSHTVNLIHIDPLDVSKFKKHDIIVIKEAGKYHTTPIKGIIEDDGDFFLDLLIPMDAPASASVAIAPSQVLVLDKTQNKTLSLRKVFDGDKIHDDISGLRTQTIQLQNFVTGEYASWLFNLVGLDYKEVAEVSPLSLNPLYPDNNPPLILSACIFKNGVKITANEFTLSMEQTVSFKTSTCASNGKVSSRPTGKYNISGTINPYMSQDSIDWKLDESEFSIFVRAFNPTVDGEYKEVLAVYLPVCKATAKEEADVEGLLADQVTFKLVPNSAEDSVVIAFI